MLDLRRDRERSGELGDVDRCHAAILHTLYLLQAFHAVAIAGRCLRPLCALLQVVALPFARASAHLFAELAHGFVLKHLLGLRGVALPDIWGEATYHLSRLRIMFR